MALATQRTSEKNKEVDVDGILNVEELKCKDKADAVHKMMNIISKKLRVKTKLTLVK